MDPWVRGALGLLLAGNIFFVKRLVDEIDNTKQAVIILQERVAVISSQLNLRDAAWTQRSSRVQLKDL